MDNVIISIKAKQKGPDGQVENVQHKMKGRYFFKSGKHYLLYADRHIDKKNEISTTIKIADDEFVIIRRGSVDTEQRFIINKETRSNYKTPYGIMELTMHTHDMQADFSENEGLARLRYSLAANGSHVGEYELEIKINSR